MARTSSIKTRIVYKRVKGHSGKPRLTKVGKVVNKVRSKMPKKIGTNQIVAGMNSDAAKLKGVQAIEHGKNVRTGLVTTAGEIAQSIATFAPKPTARISSTSQKSDLGQLVQGGTISNTSSNRDEDDNSSEVN